MVPELSGRGVFLQRCRQGISFERVRGEVRSPVLHDSLSHAALFRRDAFANGGKLIISHGCVILLLQTIFPPTDVWYSEEVVQKACTKTTAAGRCAKQQTNSLTTNPFALYSRPSKNDGLLHWSLMTDILSSHTIWRSRMLHTRCWDFT